MQSERLVLVAAGSWELNSDFELPWMAGQLKAEDVARIGLVVSHKLIPPFRKAFLVET
jgi:hypothetical protein